MAKFIEVTRNGSTEKIIIAIDRILCVEQKSLKVPKAIITFDSKGVNGAPVTKELFDSYESIKAQLVKD